MTYRIRASFATTIIISIVDSILLMTVLSKKFILLDIGNCKAMLRVKTTKLYFQNRVKKVEFLRIYKWVG